MSGDHLHNDSQVRAAGPPLAAGLPAQPRPRPRRLDRPESAVKGGRLKPLGWPGLGRSRQVGVWGGWGWQPRGGLFAGLRVPGRRVGPAPGPRPRALARRLGASCAGCFIFRPFSFLRLKRISD